MKSIHRRIGALCCALLVALALAMPGCQTLAERPAIAQLAVQYATVKVLQNNPAHAPRVVEIAQFVRANAGNSSATTVALLEAAVRSQIDWSKLDPADTLLVDALIVTVREELIARLGAGPLSPENVLIVGEVAGWIEVAAQLATPPTNVANR